MPTIKAEIKEANMKKTMMMKMTKINLKMNLKLKKKITK